MMRQRAAILIGLLILILTVQLLTVQSQAPDPQDMLATLQKLAGTLELGTPGSIRGLMETLNFPTPVPRRTQAPRVTSISPTRQPTVQAARPTTTTTTDERGEESNVLFRFADRININNLQVFTLITLATWFGSLIILFWIGNQLNRSVRGVLHRSIEKGMLVFTRGEDLLERGYRVVLIILSASFFLSIPVLLLFVVTFFITFNPVIALNSARIIILAISGFVCYVCLRTILIAFLSLGKGSKPSNGTLSREVSLKLWQLSDDVAKQVGVKPATLLYILPPVRLNTRIVGSFIDMLLGRHQIQLDVGLAALGRLSQTQFRALLAGEYLYVALDRDNHSLDKRMILSLQIMMLYIVDALKAKGFIHQLNPVFSLYMLIVQSYIAVTTSALDFKLLESDQKVAELYGSNTYGTALLQLLHDRIEFDLLVKREIEAAKTERRPLQNVYQLPPLDEAEKSLLMDTFNLAALVPQHEKISTLSLAARLKFIKNLPERWFMSAEGFGETPAVLLLDDYSEQQEIQTRTLQFFLNVATLRDEKPDQVNSSGNRPAN